MNKKPEEPDPDDGLELSAVTPDDHHEPSPYDDHSWDGKQDELVYA